MIEKECEVLLSEIDFSNFRYKNVLVTGASGLIGIYLVNCLRQLKKTNELEIFAWFKSDLPSEFEGLFNNCNIIKGDVCDYKNYNELPKFDLIIHAAGYGQPGKFLEDRIKTISLNTSATINLFNHLKVGGKFVFVSTSELYSGIDSEKVSEIQIGNTNTDHPRACYIEGKRCGETICHSFSQNNVDVKIIRLSLAYGPGTKIGDKRVLNSLIEKGMFNDKIELLDGGEAVRTYCYITDVVKMFWNIILHSKNITYNVGGDSKVTILELANMISKLLGKEVSVPSNYKSLDGNPKVVNISIDSYCSEFGTPNFVKLEDGLLKTLNWQKKIYDKNYKN